MESPKPKQHFDKYEPFYYPIGERIKIPSFAKPPIRDFLEIILSRRSSSNLKKASFNEVLEIIYLSMRVDSIGIDENGFYLSKRTAPSGGARHPVDILVSSNDKLSDRDLYYYNPIGPSINKLTVSDSALTHFFNKINSVLPIESANLIWFSIQPNKTGSKYYNPESIYWRDVGVLIYCIQLITEYLGMHSCPIGTLANEAFNNLFDSNKVISGGGIAIGS